MGRVAISMSNTTATAHGLAASAALFASSAIGVVIWNERVEVEEANATFWAMMNESGEVEQTGVPLDRFVAEEQRGRFVSSLGEISRTRGCRVFELTCLAQVGKTKEGRKVPMLVAAVAKSAPESGGLCLFFHAEPETNERRKHLSYRMASIGQFAAGVAHEVNNPLAYAMGNLSFAIEQLQTLLDRAPELKVVLAALRDALEGTERVRRTVRDLKMFGRPGSGRQAPVDVERALGAAVSMATVEIRHRAQLVFHCAPLDYARANESQLAHMFLNLLLNAAYSIPEGDVRNYEIRVEARNEPPDDVAVEITVMGPGISTTAAGDVLDPYPVSQYLEGAGFGVAVCHRLVSDCGGQLFLRNEPGQRATFRILIPRAKERPNSLPVHPGGTGARQRARVLVVDDEPRIGSAITRILDPVHEVTSVYTAQDAILRLEKGEEYDVILCDILMPQMSGYDLYQSLAQIAPQSLGRIIFMTGGPFSTRGASFLDTVPNRRLEKPFSPEALRTLVQRSLP